jgi:predicted aconitase with swiveling domain
MLKGRGVSAGVAVGEALVTRQPLSFYGGVDAKTGLITEKGHPLEGQSVRDKVLVFPRAKGSTVGSYVIYGLVKNGVAPKALVNEQTETIVATGAILAGIPCVDGIDIGGLQSGDRLEVDADRGTVRHV